MGKERNRVTISAEITNEQRDTLKEISTEKDRSVSWLIREALNEYFRKFNGETVNA